MSQERKDDLEDLLLAVIAVAIFAAPALVCVIL